MTNFERWKEYTSGLPSPENYLDWAWYYTISAALQRRVWLPPEHQPCYPNLYVILVGNPGLGKGLAIKRVVKMLKHWTLDVSQGNQNIAKTQEDKSTTESIIASDLKHAQEVEYQGKKKNADVIKPLLIPVCADAITYEALVLAVGDAYRRINYVDTNSKTSEDKPKLKIYGHSSLCFTLEELSSLLRKRTNDTVNYLLGLYDCPVDYEYTTITRGKDRVRRGCLNLIAGTTPSFMQSTFDESLIGEGFTSRTHFIYASKNRKHMCWLPELTTEQKQYETVLLEHIKKLTTIYGEVRMSEESKAFMQEWWEDYNTNHISKHQEMVPWESRMNIHVMKLAMALHFGEDAEQDEFGRPKNEISLETFRKAILILSKEKQNMHLAITLEGNNPIAKTARKVLEILRQTKKVTFVDLHIATIKIVGREQLEETLEFLTVTNQIETEQVRNEELDTNTIYYRLI